MYKKLFIPTTFSMPFLYQTHVNNIKECKQKSQTHYLFSKIGVPLSQDKTNESWKK